MKTFTAIGAFAAAAGLAIGSAGAQPHHFDGRLLTAGDLRQPAAAASRARGPVQPGARQGFSWGANPGGLPRGFGADPQGPSMQGPSPQGPDSLRGTNRSQCIALLLPAVQSAPSEPCNSCPCNP